MWNEVICSKAIALATGFETLEEIENLLKLACKIVRTSKSAAPWKSFKVSNDPEI